MKKKLKAVLPIAGLLLALVSARASAQTTTITDLSDQALRAAVASGGTVLIGGDGTITFTNTITITADTVLDATGHQVTLSGGNAVRLFSVATNVRFTVINLTIAHGRSEGGSGILNNGGVLTLQRARFQNNTAIGLEVTNVTEGGALLNWGGTVDGSNCWFFGNSATNGGSTAAGAQGGAVANEGGQMTVCNSTFLANTAETGGINAELYSLAAPGSRGGAIYNSGDLAVNLCTFASNSATGGAGYHLLLMPTLWSTDGGSAIGGAVANSGALTVDATSFAANNVAGGNGAHGANADELPTLGAGGMPGGWGGAAGGSALFSCGPLILTRSTFTANSAHGGSGGYGGTAIYIAPYPQTGGDGGNGGSASGAVTGSGQCSVTNCTFAGNLASGGAGGGGGDGMGARNGPGGTGGDGGNGGLATAAFSFFATGPSFLVNCTIAANQAVGATGGQGGDGYLSSSGTPGTNGAAGGLSCSAATLANNLLAANLPTNCQGSIIDGGHNLSSDASVAFAAPGSRINVDPLLGPLADNGGPTMTVSLLPGSPAIDAGDGTAAPRSDQRGVPRLGPVDIGAFEACFVPALQITPGPSGGFHILVTGPTGQPCRLFSSTTLTDWNTLVTNQIAPDGTVTFHVPPSSDAQMFFRAVIP